MNLDNITNVYDFKDSIKKSDIIKIVDELKKIENKDSFEIKLLIDENNLIETSLNTLDLVGDSLKNLDFNTIIMIVFDTMFLFNKITFFKFIDSQTYKMTHISQQTKKQQFVEIGIRQKNNISDILEFMGSVAQCVEFLNKWRMIYHIRCHDDKCVVMSINKSDWLTYEQLIERGLIK